ncbi:thiamine diphosphokinase [Gemmobacter fulvus]|uniref:thiamine diphosphokinase n=1 Tax=Gemmobacter fulvus TaxID=2840474 RepID=UPI0027965B03|nr:thiamine diphosphokinase [Gemmobacter fulvus]MDQ1849397.1 thiamine diphosphokinase [Gemmobacter fulvus]
MNHPIVESCDAITLIAGGPCTRADLALARRRAPVIVAVDGGADRALALGAEPVAVIGDFDSLSEAARQRLGPARLHRIAEQETTDFDKALRSVAAPFVLALGVAGGRIDHELAVLNALVQHQAAGRAVPCLLIGVQDVIFAAPPELTLRLRVGDRLSLFPMGRVTGDSVGLRWPITGLNFAPDGRIGTSNTVTQAEVQLRFDAPNMLVMLPRARLDAALRALVPGFRLPRRSEAGVR